MSLFKNWGVLMVLSFAIFIIVIDTTIMNVSISALVEDLNTNVSGIQAAITLYALVMAAFFITGGKIGDIIGRKKAFIIGTIIYGVGTVATAFSWNLGMLILGWSIIEGLGAALMLPILQTLLRSNYDKNKLSLCYGVIGAVAAGGAALGPIVGGFLTTALTWRVAFLGEFIIVAIILIFSYIIKDAELEGKRPTLDIPGVILSASGLAILVYGVIQASVYGWFFAKKPFLIGEIEFAPFNLSITVVLVFISFIILFIFFLWERILIKKGRDPLIDVSIFKNKSLRTGVSLSLIQNVVQMGVLFCIPLLLQISFDYSSFQSGLIMLPLSIAILFTSLAGAVLSVKKLPQVIISTGFFFVIIGVFVFVHGIHREIDSTRLWPGFLIFGAGIGLIVSQLVNFVLSVVSEERVSEASGLNATFQQLGASLGTAVAGTILLSTLAFSAVNGVEASMILSASQKEEVIAAVDENVEFVSDNQLEKILREVPEEVSLEIMDINRESRIQAIKMALFSLAIFAAIGLIISLGLFREKELDKL